MIDSERLYFAAEREMAAAYGKEIRDEQLWPLMGRKPIEALGLLRGILGIDTPAEELFAWRNRLMVEKMDRDLGAMPGLYEILRAFHGRLKLAVGTGAQQEFLDIALDTLRIRALFRRAADGRRDSSAASPIPRSTSSPAAAWDCHRGNASCWRTRATASCRQGRRLPSDRRAHRLHPRPGLLRGRLGRARLFAAAKRIEQIFWLSLSSTNH